MDRFRVPQYYTAGSVCASTRRSSTPDRQCRKGIDLDDPLHSHTKIPERPAGGDTRDAKIRANAFAGQCIIFLMVTKILPTLSFICFADVAESTISLTLSNA